MKSPTAANIPPAEEQSIVVKMTGSNGCPSCQAAGDVVTKWRIRTRHRPTLLANIQEAYVQCTSCLQTRNITRKELNTLGKIITTGLMAQFKSNAPKAQFQWARLTQTLARVPHT